MKPTIEYATTADGRRIATFAIGDGKALVVPPTPPWSHVLQEFQIPTAGAWHRELAKHVRLIRFDCRGTGLSDREPLDFSTDALVRDLEAVADHWGIDSFALLGSIGGSPMSIAYAGRHPERVSHLIMWSAYAQGRRLMDKFTGWEAFTALIAENYELSTNAFAQTSFGWADSDTAARYAQLHRDAMTQEATLELVRSVPLIDVTAEASAIRAPTLVMTRRGAWFYTPAEAGYFASLIPGARLLVLEGASEVPFLEDPQSVTAAILDFLASDVEVRMPRPAPAPLTEREQEVLRLLAGGQTGKEIAQQLGISVPTVQRHIANIYAKIGARGRVEAAAYAFEHGIVTRRR